MSLWPHFLGPRCIGYSNLGLVVSYYLDLLSTLQAAANILKQLYRFFIFFSEDGSMKVGQLGHRPNLLAF